MINIFQNLLTTNLKTSVSVNNKGYQTNPFLLQTKTDTFEKSNVAVKEKVSNAPFASLLSFTGLYSRKKEILEQLRIHYPDMTETDFFRAMELLSIKRQGEQQLSRENIWVLTQLPDEQYKQAKEILYIKERGKNQLDAYTVFNIAQLPAKAFKQAKEVLYVKERENEQIEGCWDIIHIAELPAKKFKQAKEILYVKGRKNGELDNYISYIAKLPTEQFKQAKEILYIKERGKQQFAGDYIYCLAQLPAENFKQAKEILYIQGLDEYQLTGEEINNLAKLPAEKFQQAKEILYVKERKKNQIIPYMLIDIAKLPAKDFKQAKKLLYIQELGQNQLSGYEIYGIAKTLPAELFARLKSSIKKFDSQKEKVMAHPQLYINGDIESSSYQKAVDEFFANNREVLLELGTIYDEDCINNILRLRFDDAKEVLGKFGYLDKKFKTILNKLVNAKDINGKPFSSAQKTDFIDICNAYNLLNIPTDIMQKGIKADRVDITELKLSIFKYILKKQFGYTEKEIAKMSKEKLLAWDTTYIHKLYEECQFDDFNRYVDINDDVRNSVDAFCDVIDVANCYKNFTDYIHEKNLCGHVNAETKQEFSQLKMNYEKWVHTTAKPVSFVVKDKNTENLSQITKQLEADINELRKNDAVKIFIDKRFPKHIKGGNFFASDINNKNVLETLIQELLKQLAPLKQRALENIKNNKNLKTAQKVLTIFSHLAQRLDDIQKTSNIKTTKSIDWTIKMWDRYPQKDLFQGNYSTCCIGIGNGNGSAMPHYLLNTAFNMIEIIDSKTGKVKGNALCYFVKDQNNKPIFIIDNIEIANSAKLSDEKGIELRNAIAEYASKVAKEVIGKNNAPVFISNKHNDVPVYDLPNDEKTISFIGDIDCNTIYMDLFDGWTNHKDCTNTKRTILKLK